MRIYLDTCCLNRPFDDQTQDRIRLETVAIHVVLRHVENKEWKWIGSDILLYEIANNPDVDIRFFLLKFLDDFDEIVPISKEIFMLAEEFEKNGIQSFDALHLASAYYGKVDFFFTVDDLLLKKSSLLKKLDQINLKNPLEWILKFGLE